MKKVRVVIIVGMCVAALGAVEAGAQEADAKSPCSAPEHSQFDFWVGSWRVTDTEGVFQGTNRIEKILGGCALQEHWQGLARGNVHLAPYISDSSYNPCNKFHC